MSTFEPQTFHSERKGDCFTVRPNDAGTVDLCLLNKEGRWCAVATFHHESAAKWYIEYMCDFLETYEPKEQ